MLHQDLAGKTSTDCEPSAGNYPGYVVSHLSCCWQTQNNMSRIAIVILVLTTFTGISFGQKKQPPPTGTSITILYPSFSFFTGAEQIDTVMYELNFGKTVKKSDKQGRVRFSAAELKTLQASSFRVFIYHSPTAYSK